MRISVVIPLHNERGTLVQQHKEIREALDIFGEEYEMVFVDDGSDDGSPDILRDIRREDKKVKVVVLKKNYGKTNALIAGVRVARGEYLLFIDADLQFYAKDLRQIVEGLKEYDAVISYRTNRRQCDGILKLLSSRVANYVRNKLLGEDLKDAGCALTGFRRKCIEGLNIYDDFDVLIPSMVRARGFSIKEVPIETKPRKTGTSHFGLGNRAFRKLSALLAFRWMKSNEISYDVSDQER